MENQDYFFTCSENFNHTLANHIGNTIGNQKQWIIIQYKQHCDQIRCSTQITLGKNIYNKYETIEQTSGTMVVYRRKLFQDTTEKVENIINYMCLNQPYLRVLEVSQKYLNSNQKQ